MRLFHGRPLALWLFLKGLDDVELNCKSEVYTEATFKEVLVKRLENVILANLDDVKFSIHHLSRELALSRSQAHRKVKALTGMSTAVYIRNVRLQKAKELLISTELPISEIAYQVGFRTLPYFSQAFKDAFGESPSATRI